MNYILIVSENGVRSKVEILDNNSSLSRYEQQIDQYMSKKTGSADYTFAFIKEEIIEQDSCIRIHYSCKLDYWEIFFLLIPNKPLQKFRELQETEDRWRNFKPGDMK